MRPATTPRQQAAQLPEGDIVRVLSEQHARLTELFLELDYARDPQQKSAAFDELRTLLRLHEPAEENVLRPITTAHGAGEIAAARRAEELAVSSVLVDLEEHPVASPEFDARLDRLRAVVQAHAAAEEAEEFPLLLETLDAAERVRIGSILLKVESLTPTDLHPRPAAAAVSPAASRAVAGSVGVGLS